MPRGRPKKIHTDKPDAKQEDLFKINEIVEVAAKTVKVSKQNKPKKVAPADAEQPVLAIVPPIRKTKKEKVIAIVKAKGAKANKITKAKKSVEPEQIEMVPAKPTKAKLKVVDKSKKAKIAPAVVPDKPIQVRAVAKAVRKAVSQPVQDPTPAAIVKKSRKSVASTVAAPQSVYRPIQLPPPEKKKRGKVNKLCITGCERKARTEGFCGLCHAKFLKGKITKSGAVHPSIIAKEKAKAARKVRIASHSIKKKREETKQIISKGLNNNLLRVLQDTVPESKVSKYCKSLEFFTCDAVCYSRLFVLKRPECERCKIHDDSFDFLQNFIKENSNDKSKNNS